MRKLGFAISLLIVVVACQKYPEKIKQIDKLAITADSLETEWKKSDTIDHQEVYDKVIANIRVIQNKLSPDMITRDQAIKELSDYRSIRKGFTKFASATKLFKEQIPHRKDQLENLKTDILNGHFESEDKINEAIQDELSRLMTLKAKFEEYQNNVPMIYKVRDRVEPFIDSLVVEIKKKEDLEQ